ncbi:MAG TPA: glycosyltransferase [Reyranella sp.]|jgi:glycosyltransferase involved in cell wall biosynthesis
MTSAADRPLVSIFMFVRNGGKSLRRAIDSVFAQTYPNIEFVVQDAVSTDGTLDLLRSYGDRIKVVSEPDSGPSEGLWRAMNRCSGTFVGSCLADEELMPDAVERAVRAFQESPSTGAVTGDAWITDIDGKITGSWTSGPFTLVDYLLASYSPYFVSSFFRRDVLLAVGLREKSWNLNCVEFELWCRIASHTHVKYVPHVLAKYAQHPGQLSNSFADSLIHVEGRMANIVALCAPGGFFDDRPLMRNLFIWGHARTFCNHALQVGKPELAHAEYDVIKKTLAERPPVLLDGILYDENYERRLAEAQRDSGWRSMLARLGRRAPAPKEELALPPPPDSKLKARLHAQEALCHEAKGNLLAARDSWHAAALAVGVVTPEQVGRRTDRKYGWAAVTS